MNFKAFGQLLQEMLDYLAGSSSRLTDFNVGSATRSFMEAVALVLAEVHYLGQQLISRFYVSTAMGQWLDLRAAEYGIPRVESSPTTRTLTVSHAAGPAVTIPAGWQAGTPPGAAVGVIYQATQEMVLGAGAGSVDLPAISTTVGAATAIPAGTALRQVGRPLAYVETVATGAFLVAGTDRETDDHLRARVLDRLQHPPGPGSAADYERAVLDAFPGVVESVTVVANWAGPGTVLVLILGPGNSVPDAGTIADVQVFLDGWAPIGAVVTVAAPAVVAVDVRATVTAGAGFEWGAVETAAQLAIRTLLDGLAIGEDVRIAAVGDALWRTAGVGGATGGDGGNYTGLQLRVSPAAFAAADLPIADTAKAVSGTLTLTEA